MKMTSLSSWVLYLSEPQIDLCHMSLQVHSFAVSLQGSRQVAKDGFTSMASLLLCPKELGWECSTLFVIVVLGCQLDDF